MGTWSRYLRYAAVFVFGAVVGGALVFWQFTRPVVEMLSLTTALQLDEKTYAVYRFGAYPVAREAMLNHIQWVETFSGSPDVSVG